MKKFYKVEAFRPGEESAVKHVFNVYSLSLRGILLSEYTYIPYF